MRLLLPLLLLAGCPKPAPVEPAPPPLTESQAWIVHESGLRHEDLVVGAGELVQSGSRIKAHYTGWLHDGSKFDSSHDRGEPLAITVDEGQVIKGWDEGLQGMRVGGKRKLLIPPSLGYGAQDMGIIPPNSVLTFEVEVVESHAPRKPAAAPVQVDPESYRQTETGLLIADIGGDCTPLEHPVGARLDVEYDGFLASGRLFDSSRLRETAFTLPLGLGRVIAGWEEGLADAPVGCMRQLVIPPHLAYGESGTGTIPPNATLTFDVEVVDIGMPRVAPLAPQPATSHLTSGTGLKVAILEPGDGVPAANGDMVRVEYTGWLSDGTRFDSSFLRDQAIDVPVGMGRVIAGWDEGLLGMKPGELRQLIIPANLAYGEAGRPPTIPGGETLTFEVRLLEKIGAP